MIYLEEKEEGVSAHLLHVYLKMNSFSNAESWLDFNPLKANLYSLFFYLTLPTDPTKQFKRYLLIILALIICKSAKTTYVEGNENGKHLYTPTSKEAMKFVSFQV